MCAEDDILAEDDNEVAYASLMALVQETCLTLDDDDNDDNDNYYDDDDNDDDDAIAEGDDEASDAALLALVQETGLALDGDQLRRQSGHRAAQVMARGSYVKIYTIRYN